MAEVAKTVTGAVALAGLAVASAWAFLLVVAVLALVVVVMVSSNDVARRASWVLHGRDPFGDRVAEDASAGQARDGPASAA